MKYIKFETLEAAEEYKIKLQTHHDETVNLNPANPRVIDMAFKTYDGKFALSLHDETYPDVGDGEICGAEGLYPPPIEEPI